MSRLAALMKNKGKTNDESKTEPKLQTSKENEEKAQTSEQASENQRNEQASPPTETEPVQVLDAKPVSRLEALGLEKVEPIPELAVDEEIEKFKRDLNRLNEMVDAEAPELREGLLSIIERMQTKSHLEEFLYQSRDHINKAVRAFRAQFNKRNKEVVIHRKKRSAKAAEVDDFLAGLD